MKEAMIVREVSCCTYCPCIKICEAITDLRSSVGVDVFKEHCDYFMSSLNLNGVFTCDMCKAKARKDGLSIGCMAE